MEMAAQEDEFNNIVKIAARRPSLRNGDTERLANLLERVMGNRRKMHNRMQKLKQRSDRLQQSILRQRTQIECRAHRLHERNDELAIAQSRIQADGLLIDSLENQLQQVQWRAENAAQGHLHLA